MPQHTARGSSAGHPRGPRPIEAVATSVAAFIGRADRGPVGSAVPVDGWGAFEREFGGLTARVSLAFQVRDFFANGGSRAVVVRVDGTGGEAVRVGLAALDAVDVHLLVLPPDAADADATDTNADDTHADARAAVAAAAAFCERRRAMLLLDPPTSWTSAEAILAATSAPGGIGALIGTTSANAALYAPRLRQPDPLRGGADGVFAASGAVAGVIARTDATSGVWTAPAGRDAELRGADGVDVHLRSAHLARLAAGGVNALRDLPPGGPVVWGARTLAGADTAASEWKYVPVRRMALFLEQSIERGLRWATFEPNDEPLWTSVRRTVETFLFDLFRAGAFRGLSPAEAFFVRCGRDTMTQDDVDAGRLVVVVGFAPIMPTEFVVVRIGVHAVAPTE
ncbi:phage tail sheath subtilisin-like domain-containing protein [Agromyces sp. Soil535]|uniref:phage tail sheath family protein n=1 Tax=Agromyces sp. Soil535 TaxID=1736390 RepID=UPI0006F7AF82|nr:phage tail sheath subtilisin-like domain-containing protein [Agromyces sp. Soil535]KRE28892.1 hypothetical protein ASG80_20675 [Agromyces sp. Soil535]